MAKRLNLDISDDLHAYLCDLASRRQTTTADIVRKGLAVMKAADRYMDSTSEPDPARLDVMIVGILD